MSHNHTHRNDHSHGHNHDHHGHHHKPSSKGRLLMVILFNAIITLAEFIGGLLSGSLALISDAWHNLSDVLSLMLGYTGEKVSEKSGTSQYTFGLKRFEVFIALVNAMSLMVIGVIIVYEAVERFLNPVDVNIGIMLPVAVIGLLGNVFSILVLARNRKDTINLRAAFLHLLYDAVSSMAVIVAAVVIHYTGMLWIDLVISLVIVVMMVWSTADIFKEAWRIFMQSAPSYIDTEEVLRKIEEVRGVGDVHGLHIWSVSSSEVFLSCHICVEESMNDTDTDDIIRRVNSLLEEEFRIEHTTLQVENSMLCSAGNGTCCNRPGA